METDRRYRRECDDVVDLLLRKRWRAMGPYTGQARTSCHSPGLMEYADAVATTVRAGDGWRVPELAELQAVVDYGRGGNYAMSLSGDSKVVWSPHERGGGAVARPAARPEFEGLLFVELPFGLYWTSTPLAADQRRHWHVNFVDGSISHCLKTNRLQLLAVRNDS